ncbi:EAL domain-containing protein [Treponema sp.]|uniref:EAL domain-containing protein n=1 Tax=Treponema sp. TaxID=166 RepID=UPI003890B7AB
MEQTYNNDSIESLKKQLFYESQYRKAIISDAICYYDANLTKDLIEKEVFYIDEEGKLYPSLKLVDLKAPCKFSEFIDRWVKKFIDPDYASKHKVFFNTKDFLIESFKNGKKDYIIDYWYTNDKGKELFLSQRFFLTQNEDGDICTLAVLNNTTHAKKIEEQQHKDELEHYAYYDPITNGYNYIKFQKKLTELGTPGSIISIDIHAFKIINTICGIGTGDKVIKAIWNRIEEVFDYSRGELAAHINADQFIIFCPTVDQKEIIPKLKAISYALNLISADLSVPQMKPYFGISSWNPNKKIEMAYSEAVTAKNNAKKLQKSEYAFFEEKDMDSLVHDESIIDGFEDALAQNEFNIWYQPKYNPESHTMIGAEALVRWIRNGKSFTSPSEFIPIFENNGLIKNFDQYIFRKVCEQQKKWLDEGKKVVPVSINLSRISLYYKDIVSIYTHIVDTIGIDKKLIPIEITETAAVTNSSIMDIAESFIKAGFVLHMDDFGSGYSSLSTLNTMQFETWKLDKSLIDFIGNYGGERLIVHMVQLAKELGIHITAEGVETKEQTEFLLGIGCDSIQGYFYSKPLPLKDFEAFLD